MNPGQKLQRANHDYHEAIEEMLLDEDLSLKLKIELSCKAEKVFVDMVLTNDIVAAFYGVG